MAKKLTKKSFLNLSPSDIGRLKAPELRELLRGARNLFTQQEKTFNRYKETVWSPALDKMQDYYDENGKQNPSRMSVSKMRNEVFRLQEFFDSKSATIPGARKIAIEQDARIFGVNERGKPNDRLKTVAERRQFWAVYNEYAQLRPADVHLQSRFYQQALGQMVVETRKAKNETLDVSAETLDELYRRVQSLKMAEWERMNYEYGESDVFSGKRPY